MANLGAGPYDMQMRREVCEFILNEITPTAKSNKYAIGVRKTEQKLRSRFLPVVMAASNVGLKVPKRIGTRSP